MVYVRERPISRKPSSPVNWPLLMKVSYFTSVFHVGYQPNYKKSRKNLINIH